MDGRNNSGNNKPLTLYSDAEITELAKKMVVNNNQFTEEDYIRLIKASYVPKQRKVVHIDQEHDVIYYAAEENEIKELEKSPKQSGSSTGQIYNTLHNLSGMNQLSSDDALISETIENQSNEEKNLTVATNKLNPTISPQQEEVNMSRFAGRYQNAPSLLNVIPEDSILNADVIEENDYLVVSQVCRK